ncbi:MAG: YtxH domain-containing protein [Chitinophagaceae bacterium]|nr:YtxH domain-containing protein [Chitinophagaceae bacterium]
MSSSKVLVGFLAGAAVGALAGILFAPDKGSETRKKIAGKAGDLRDAVKEKFNALGDTLRNTFSHVEEEAEKAGEKISSKVSAAKNALS